MIIIDTDILIEIFDKKSKAGSQAFEKIIDSKDTFCVTVINLHEILYGLLKYAKPMDDVMLLPTLNFTKEDAKLSSQIEFKTEAKGKRALRTDSMIAAIAINNNAKLYTNNTAHFKDIDKLELF